MMSAGRLGKASIAIALFSTAGLFLQSVPVGADVRSSTEMRDYRVGGTTAASLVNFMKTRPFPGDRGAAVANIRPNYSLSIFTRDQGKDGVCQATKVDLSIHFVMTLPKANTPASMAGGTLSAWNGFVGFARRHEETHRSIYVDCANGFVAKALRLTSKDSCGALESNIRKLLEAEKRACEQKQNAFDNRDYRRVFGLSLFSMAKYSNRKPAQLSSKKPAGSRSIMAPGP